MRDGKMIPYFVNPISPPGVYIADPEGREGLDGNFYVYGSSDNNQLHYCSRKYDVLSTSDLLRWNIDRTIFDTSGVPGSVGARLFAPDAIEHDGRWILYYCLSNGLEGTAVSAAPTGPFTDPQTIGGIQQIDPSVFIDDNGQGYIYWGQYNAKAAKLTPDMRQIVPGSIVDNVVTEAQHYFHEGSSVRKRNGIYYYIYAHIGRRGRPTCIGYATSLSPMGPFEYRGVIIDNYGCDPGVWNNHGSIASFGGDWYIFYHRSTHGSKTMRKACVERIGFDCNGLIPEVQMTSSGVLSAIDAFNRIPGYAACEIRGGACIRQTTGIEEVLAGLSQDDAVCFRWIDFWRPIRSINLCLAGPRKGGAIEVRIDAVDGPLLAIVNVRCELDAESYIVNSADTLIPVSGVREVWLRCLGGEGAPVCDLRWFQFGVISNDDLL